MSESRNTLSENGFELSKEKHVFMNGFYFPMHLAIRFGGIFFAKCLNINGDSFWCNEQGETLSHKVFGVVESLEKYKDGNIYINFNGNFLDYDFLSFTESGELSEEIVDINGEKYIYKDKTYVKCGCTMDFGDALISLSDGVAFFKVGKNSTGEIVHHDTKNLYKEPDCVEMGGKRYFFNLGAIRDQRDPQRSKYKDEVVSSKNNLRIQLGLKEDIQSANIERTRYGLSRITYTIENGEETIFLVTEEGNRVSIRNSDSGFFGNKKLSDCEVVGSDGKVIGTIYLEYDIGGVSNILQFEGQKVTKVSNTSVSTRIRDEIDLIQLELEGGNQVCVYDDFTPFIVDGKYVGSIETKIHNNSDIIITFQDGEKEYYQGGERILTETYKTTQATTLGVKNTL